VWIALVPRGVLGKGRKNEKSCLDYGDLDRGLDGALATVLLGTCGQGFGIGKSAFWK
jgi:hypothetical protein